MSDETQDPKPHAQGHPAANENAASEDAPGDKSKWSRVANAQEDAKAAGTPSSDDAQAGVKEEIPQEPDPLEVLRDENAELKDKALRLMAEMENLRRRMEREKNDMAKYAISNFARDVLGISDNLRRAIDHVPEDAAQADTALKALLDGVEMTERELLNVMERHGIKKLDPLGTRFDPNFHQAMFEIPDETVPDKSVAQVVQVGYVIGERVLRPAMVGVTKGGPKSGASTPEQETQNTPTQKPPQEHVGHENGAQSTDGNKTAEAAPKSDAQGAGSAQSGKPVGSRLDRSA